MDCQNAMSVVAFWTRRFCCSLLLGLTPFGLHPTSFAAVETSEDVTYERGDAEWIWSPAHTKNEVPVGDCYFRKSFLLKKPSSGEIRATADNRFELFVNGQPIGQSKDWRQMQVFDISKQLRVGRNSVSARVTNTDAGSAGFVARVLVKEEGSTFRSYSTDESWKTSVRRYQSWTSPEFPDSQWVTARSYGALGATLPWGDEVVLAGKGTRFQIRADFAIERLMRDEEVGSLIAMAFDAQGNILASREGGHLLRLTDSDNNGTHDTVSMFCDKIRNVQGILPLGSRVFAVGDGPEGAALYRLHDANRDGVAEELQAIVPLRGSKGEHGAHAVRLGPDGLLYVIVGNHARIGRQPGPHSPYQYWYEGDLVQPRHEDPRGHAVGIPAPGGTIFRTDEEGSFVELVAGGLRNSYDFALNAAGEIFTYDSDMEWDLGAPWYRPTRVNHVTAGAELGWRSGWAKWPESYLDSLPAAVHVGAGSPTGVEFYNHHAFPPEYQGAMFGCDWAGGKIYCFRLQPQGATYRGKSEVFVEGRPLNATDIAVGPDGSLYFCTGGRGTDGGIYRIRWTGKQGAATTDLGQGIERVLRQPQLDADWAKAQTANLLRELGGGWVQELENVVQDKARNLDDRLRALELTTLFGPRPSQQVLLSLSRDKETKLRAKAAQLMFRVTTPECRNRLVQLLEDPQPMVRRVACESLMRQGSPAPAVVFANLLADEDRFVVFAARRALEQLPAKEWSQLVLSGQEVRPFCHGAASLLAVSRSRTTALAVLAKCETALARASLAGDDPLRLDLLRLVQLALIHGNLAAEDVPTLGQQLLAGYPSGNRLIDRELVRLLVYLQQSGAAEKFAEQLATALPLTEKLHLGAYAAGLKTGWERESKLTFMKFYEASRATPGGYSLSAYLENFARDFFTKLTLQERQAILATGEHWPSSALSILAKLPADPGRETLRQLRDLEGRIKPLCAESDAYRRLRVGILAVLGRSGEAESLAYVRTIYRDEPDARHTVAMALTQHPGGENWPILVDSLKTIEGEVARQVLQALTRVPQSPRQPEDYRQAILLGLRLGEEGALDSLQLLNHWSGQNLSNTQENWSDQLAAWQQRYAKQFPTAPPAELPVDSAKDKWSYEELLSYLESDPTPSPDIERGKQAFAKAQCIKCHRWGNEGETIGPDLTTIARRFQRKEILESIVYPAHTISDQYASRIVVANGRTYTGMVVPRGRVGVTVLLTSGEKVELSHADIDDIQPHSQSPMPSGLLNALTLQQVADLFAYLEQETAASTAQKQSTTNR
ncbi:MAG: HEAT repeat domain-containing protein [Pirellulales bacterium]|nr:HEAT repeat domain-containing protein [Pirellulales bacterium]